MSNPWQQVFESHRDAIDQTYIAEKYGQHKGDDQEETQALYDLRNKMKNMGKDAVIAYLKRSKMSPERKARLARSLGVSVTEEFVDESAAQLIRLGLMAGTAAAGSQLIPAAKGIRDKLNQIQQQKIKDIKQVDPNLKMSYEPEGDSLDEKITASTDIGTAIRDFRASKSPQLAGRSSDERRKAAIAAVLQARRDAEKTKNEEFELQEEAKILVRVTKEDGSVFQKKIPASALQDYRKRYKTVVVVGSTEGGSGKDAKTSNVNEEKKKKTARWWDDDGDGVGYEKGEVSGSFKKKKKTRKEEYSDWRSESPDIAEATKAQKSVEGKAHASYENVEDKKKRKKNADESECDCSHEVKEAAELLAQELGAEFINITENVGRKILQTVLKTATKAAPAELKLGQTAPGAIVKYKPQVTAITKAKPEVTAITKPGTKQQTATKVDAKTGELVKVDVKTGQIVVADPKVKTQTKTKTLALPLTQTQTQTQTSTPAPPAPPTTGKPPAPGPKAGKGAGRLPKVKPSPGLSDPVAPASTIKA
jgi:hypothetical protein